MIGEEQKSRDLECLTANHIVVSPRVPNDHHLRKTLNIHAPVHQPLVNNTQLQDVSFRCCCSGRPCWCKVCYLIGQSHVKFSSHSLRKFEVRRTSTRVFEFRSKTLPVYTELDIGHCLQQPMPLFATIKVIFNRTSY